MKMLTIEDIQNAKDIKTKDVEVPEWGGSLTIKTLSLKEFTNITSACRRGDGSMDDLKLAIATIVEGVINPKLDPKQIEMLKERSSSVISRIVKEITDLSGHGQDLKKDLKGTTPDGTSSSSPKV